MSQEIYTVAVHMEYDGITSSCSFFNKEEALAYFKKTVKDQNWKCEVRLVGPIKLPANPLHGTTIQSKIVDPQERQRLEDKIAELQDRLDRLKSEDEDEE